MTSADTRPTADTHEAPTKLGTFGGVFAPSLLTILGLVLFLRLGYVTGNVGMLKMLVILGLSTAVSVLTTISLAAIATNLKVGGGGVYFLISRTLGPAFGGAIGLVLYVAMSVSVAFYAIGLGEAVASVIGSDRESLPRLIAAVTIVALLGLAWLGADIATRLQFVVMGCLVVAIAAYFAGVVPDLSFSRVPDNLWTPEGGESFWVAFAIFFPAITGFTQGVAMSGDLKTPSRSISLGTFSAIGVSTVVYLLIIFTLVMAVPLGALRDDTAIMRQLSIAPWLIDVGVIAATLSSAIASIMGAPRTLQRLAADRLVKPLQPFAVGAGISDNPRRGATLSAAIALLTVALGDLNVVAPIISMFFLASYGLINYATYSEARAASTSFRPRFRLFDWRLSLLGTIACLGVIIAIDPVAGAVAGAAVFALYRYLQRSVQQVRWADSTRGFHSAGVRSHLREMGDQVDAGRDWRPCTVAFVPRDLARRSRLAAVASWFEGGAGLTTVTRIVPGRGAMVRRQAARIDLELRRELESLDEAIFGRVLVADTLESGVAAMLQAHGIGGLRANLALYSWYDLEESDEIEGSSCANMVQTSIRFGCNVAIVHANDENWSRVPSAKTERGHIAVWWSDDRTGQLLTMLAWMCTRSSVWSKSTIEVLVPSDNHQPPPDVHHRDRNGATTQPGDALSEVDRVAALLDEARIPAEVTSAESSESFATAVAHAGLVLAPMRMRHGDILGPGGIGLQQLVSELPIAVFAHAAAAIALDLQPDDAHEAAVAVAQDRAIELSSRALELSETAGTLLVAAEMLRMGIDQDDGAMTVEEADRRASAAQRTYLDARARADEAWRVAREIDPTIGTDTLDPSLWQGD